MDRLTQIARYGYDRPPPERREVLLPGQRHARHGYRPGNYPPVRVGRGGYSPRSVPGGRAARDAAARSGVRVSDYYRELGRSGGYATARKRLEQMTREDLENALRQVRLTENRWQRWYWRQRVKLISAQIGQQL